MAVQKNRVTRSRRGQRRSHDTVAKSQLSECGTTGRVHRRHHMSEDGLYRGKKILEKQGPDSEDE